MMVTVPDTITEWEAGMFCMAPQGLGLSPAVTVTAFQPFFVELALPYAVVRHETFTLRATIFNYLHQCLRVSRDRQGTLGYGRGCWSCGHALAGSGEAGEVTLALGSDGATAMSRRFR